MADGRAHEGLVEHEVGALECGVDIAHGPLVRRVTERQLAFAGRVEGRLCPLQLADSWRGRALASLRRQGAAPRRCPPSGHSGPPGRRLDQRIDDEGQRLELDPDAFDRFGRRELVDGSHRQERLAFVERFARERPFALRQWRERPGPS